MADLDDFFAKRDKKKGKTKKYLSSEELVKQLEVNQLKEKEAKKQPEKIDEEAEPKAVNVEHDDEWKEFEEEKRPDLSNLKLGLLNIDDDDNNREHQDDYDENNTNDGENSDANPWKKANSTAPAPVAAPAPQKATGAYVPTHLREGGAGNRLRSKKNAPDLQNTENFPSLGTDAKPIANAWNNIPKGFEEVKHGGKQMASAAGTAPVSIGNAYSSLNESLDS